MCSNLKTVDVALFPTFEWADNTEPMLCPFGGGRLRATGRCDWLPVTLTLHPFSHYIHGWWFQLRNQCRIHFLPAPLFSCDTPIFEAGEEGEGENFHQCLKTLSPAHDTWSPFMSTYFHRLFCTTLLMYLFRERDLETHTHKAQKPSFQPSVKSNFCSKHLKSG